MPRLSQVLMPHDRVYFELFEEAGQNVLQAADLLDELLSNYPDSKSLAHQIKEREHEGDNVTHQIIRRLNTTFITPLDREDIYALATALDDVLDAIEAAADTVASRSPAKNPDLISIPSSRYNKRPCDRPRS